MLYSVRFSLSLVVVQPPSKNATTVDSIYCTNILFIVVTFNVQIH